MASLLTGGANEQRRKALLDMLSDEVFQRGLLRGAANIVPGIARGISADLLGGPVDMVTAAMNVPAGLLGKKIENPVGGSEWIGQKMEQVGLLPKATGHPAETASRIAGGLLASRQVVGRVGSAVENVTRGMARNAMVPRTLHPQTGAIVYHGTPHKFAPEPDAPLGRFRSDKIGTGEGAQAYGHGLYFAGSPDVAKEYQKKLSGTKFIEKATGNIVDTRQIPMDKMRRFNTDYEPYSGSLYKVDLPDEAIAKMLDWDKPLSQQTPEVQKAISGLVRDPQAILLARKEAFAKYDAGLITKEQLNAALSGGGAGVSEQELGKALYMRLGSQQKAADALRSAGVPGVRYLDGFSRGPQGGSGTNNYVVFPGEEGLLRILGRE